MLVLAFPAFDIEWLAWVALVPLFFALEGAAPRKAFFLAYLAGLVFFAGALYWLIHVTLPGMVAAALYLALYFGCFGLFVSYASAKQRRGRYELLFILPSAWVAIEWVRAHALTGFGWALLGHSQSFTPVVIQIADMTGAYGVSFVILLVNLAMYLTAREFALRRYDTRIAGVALLVVFVALSYGIIRMKSVFTGETARVAVVQGNISQQRKWDSSFREEIVRTYERLTRLAAAERPDLIVWPETSVPGFLGSEKDLASRVGALAVSAGTPILAGTVREGVDGAYYNSASLVSPEGAITRTYDKVHLVPFGEYIPFKKAFSFVEKFAPVPIGDCSPGRERTVFDFFVRRGGGDDGSNWALTKKIKFSCLVCFEDIFPALAREMVRAGAGFLVVITNDAWYKRSSAPLQHLQGSIFRAVENRVNVVRAANTGVSCFVDQLGRVGGIVSAGTDIFVDGYAVRDITLNRPRTFYTMYGDLFAYACMAVAVAGLMTKRRRSHGP